MSFSDLYTSYRTRKGLSKNKVSIKLGITYHTVHQYENKNKTLVPTPDNLKKRVEIFELNEQETFIFIKEAFNESLSKKNIKIKNWLKDLAQKQVHQTIKDQISQQYDIKRIEKVLSDSIILSIIDTVSSLNSEKKKAINNMVQSLSSKSEQKINSLLDIIS